MLENPVLEDPDEGQRAASGGGARRTATAPRRGGETETPTVELRDDKLDTPPEVKGDADSNEAVNEIDWEAYLDNQSAAASMPSSSHQRRSAVARGDADREDLAFDHLVADKMSQLTPRRGRRSGR